MPKIKLYLFLSENRPIGCGTEQSLRPELVVCVQVAEVVLCMTSLTTVLSKVHRGVHMRGAQVRSRRAACGHRTLRLGARMHRVRGSSGGRIGQRRRGLQRGAQLLTQRAQLLVLRLDDLPRRVALLLYLTQELLLAGSLLLHHSLQCGDSGNQLTGVVLREKSTKVSIRKDLAAQKIHLHQPPRRLVPAGWSPA